MTVHPLEQARVWTLHTPPDEHPFVRVRCDTCSTTDDLNCKVNLPPHFVANKFRQRGWKISGEGKKAKCPDCAHGRTQRKTEVCIPPQPRAHDQPVTSKVLQLDEALALAKEIDDMAKTKKTDDSYTTDPLYKQAFELLADALEHHKLADLASSTTCSTGTLYRLQRAEPVRRASTLQNVIDELTRVLSKEAPVATEVAPSREALKQQRTMFTLLEEHYLETSSRYEDGWSDERIAKECGLAVEHVAATRDAGFGPVTDPQLDEALRQAAVLRERIEQLHGDLRRDLDAWVAQVNALLQARRA